MTDRHHAMRLQQAAPKSDSREAGLSELRRAFRFTEAAMVSKSGAGKKAGATPARKRGSDKTAAPRDKSAPSPGDDPMVQVRLVSSSVDEFKRFVESMPLEFACAAPRVSRDGVVSAHALMRDSDVRKARTSDAIRLEVVAHPSDLGEEGPPEVGKGNRFEDPSTLPTGRGVLLRKPS